VEIFLGVELRESFFGVELLESFFFEEFDEFEETELISNDIIS
jgi:hypothetical protein